VAHVVQETLDEIVRHWSLKVPEPHLNLAGAADRFSLRYPTPPSTLPSGANPIALWTAGG